MARGGAVTKKVLSLRELQMAKRMLNQPKVPPCQRELTALLNAMDRKEKGEEVSIRILQTALEHCLQQSVSRPGLGGGGCFGGVVWSGVGWQHGMALLAASTTAASRLDRSTLKRSPWLTQPRVGTTKCCQP
jgi:hypothetical protein